MSIKKNDVLKIKLSGCKVKILAVIDDVYVLSYPDDFERVAVLKTLTELERDYGVPEEKFEPKANDTFWYITNTKEIDYAYWADTNWCLSVRDFMGIYPTQESAEQALAEIKEKLKK